MRTSLFLQSEVQDPYEIYKIRLRENAISKDDTNNIWSVYSYAACASVLNNCKACIPAMQQGKQGLNERAHQIVQQLARLNNGNQHTIARHASMLLFSKMKPVQTSKLMQELLIDGGSKDGMDWVRSVCRKLPVAAIAESLGFSNEACSVISDNIEALVKIMLPEKTSEHLNSINEAVSRVYPVIEKHFLNLSSYQQQIISFSRDHVISAEEAFSFCISNLIGLFIQAYDAGRGILSNSLLQMLSHNNEYPVRKMNKERIMKSVMESLRFDPPVHNTRRVAGEDIVLNTTRISKGEMIVLVLAAANRDPLQFADPGVYNIDRENNNTHLTFGTGDHNCLAKHFSVNLATDAFGFLFEKYNNISLLEKNIQYEPLINVRLPRSMTISLHN